MSKSKNGFTDKVWKSILQMTGGNTISAVAGIISNYFNALILGPTILGAWTTSQVINGYRGFFNFSLPFIMRRDFVMLRGEGKFEEANRIANLVFTFGLVISPILSVFYLLYSYFFVSDYWFKICIYVTIVISTIDIIGSFGNIISKGVNNYKLISITETTRGVMLIVGIALIILWGFWAFLINMVLISLVSSVIYYKYRPIEFKLFWDKTLFKILFLSALPLYLQDVSSYLFNSIDRVIIAANLSFESVGLYSLSSLISTPVSLVIGSTSIVLFTQLNERYGKSTEASVILKHIDVPQSIFSWIMPPVIGFGVLLMPTIVPLILPKYSNGISAAQISVFGLFFFTLTSFSSNALFVMNKQKISALIFAISGIINTTGGIIAIKLKYGIEGVAISSAFSFFIYNLLMMIVIYRIISINKIQMYKVFFDRLIPFFTVVFVLVGLSAFKIRFSQNNLVNIILTEVIFLILTAPFLLIGIKRFKVYF